MAFSLESFVQYYTDNHKKRISPLPHVFKWPALLGEGSGKQLMFDTKLTERVRRYTQMHPIRIQPPVFSFRFSASSLSHLSKFHRGPTAWL